jgi:hypothetical protein
MKDHRGDKDLLYMSLMKRWRKGIEKKERSEDGGRLRKVRGKASCFIDPMRERLSDMADQMVFVQGWQSDSP